MHQSRLYNHETKVHGMKHDQTQGQHQQIQVPNHGQQQEISGQKNQGENSEQNDDTLNKLLDTDQNTDKIPCPQCDKFFSRHDHLRTHLASVHAGPWGRRVTCPLCSKRFSRADHMRRHLNTHFPQEKIACNYCDKKFTRKDHLRSHTQNMHGITSPPKKKNSALSLTDTPDVYVTHRPDEIATAVPGPSVVPGSVRSLGAPDPVANIFPNPPMAGYTSMLEESSVQWDSQAQ